MRPSTTSAPWTVAPTDPNQRDYFRHRSLLGLCHSSFARTTCCPISTQESDLISHDPRQAIEDLRNHVAAHDRPLSFFFGAGTSCAVNTAPQAAPGDRRLHKPLIPALDALTETCREAVAAIGHEDAWNLLCQQCVSRSQSANVETLLSMIRMKIDALGDGERLAHLSREEFVELESTVCSTIATSVTPPDDSIPDHIPHDDFAVWIKRVNRTAPLEIFTTNYDILLERSLEAVRVPIFDGFAGSHQPFFYPDCLDDDALLPRANWVRLWKLHGSVNWAKSALPTGTRIVRTQPQSSGELILPSHRKYDESRKQPYAAYMDRLRRSLHAEHALLVTCGYSFGDEHINEIIFGALDNQPTCNVIALRFSDLSEDSDLTQAATQRSNLLVMAPNAGVVSTIFGEWRLSRPVDAKTHTFMDNAFDSNAVPEEESSTASSLAVTGRMRLGDFNWFGRFLRAMRIKD